RSAEDLVDQPPSALARGEHVGQRVVARARSQVEALVEFVARAQRAADEIPCEAEDPRAVAGRNFARSAQVAVDELANSWIVELRLGGSGEQVVRADKRQDFSHPRKPGRQRRPQRGERTPVGKPYPVAVLEGLGL